MSKVKDIKNTIKDVQKTVSKLAELQSAHPEDEKYMALIDATTYLTEYRRTLEHMIDNAEVETF